MNVFKILHECFVVLHEYIAVLHEYLAVLHEYIVEVREYIIKQFFTCQGNLLCAANDLFQIGFNCS